MKLNYRNTALVGLAFMTISGFWSLYNSEIPLMLEKLIGKDQFLINTIMSLDNILALFLLPLFGSLSDKTHTKLGKRMPYILVGTILAVIFTVCIPIAYNYSKPVLFFFMVGGVLLSMSIYRSPAVALMPDITPKPLRSQGNALINLMGAVGIMFASLLIILFEGENNYTLIFILMAIFMVISLVVMLKTIDENKLVAQMPPDEETEEERFARENRGVKVKGGVRCSLIFLLISVFLWYMAYSAVETNYTRYAEEVWGMVEGQYQGPMLFGTIVALISFVPLGMAAKYIGRKKTILAALGVLGFSVLMLAFIDRLAILRYLMFALVGVSWSALNVNSYPMVVEMSHGADVGKYTGLYYSFSMAAQIASPLLSGFLFDNMAAGKRILFPYSAIFLAVAVITMLFVRHGEARKLDAEELTKVHN